MDRREAIELIKHIGIAFVPTDQYGDYADPEPYEEAINMAIEALTDVVNEDGTLTVHVSDGSKVSRVLVLGDNHFGGLYYAERR